MFSPPKSNLPTPALKQGELGGAVPDGLDCPGALAQAGFGVRLGR